MKLIILDRDGVINEDSAHFIKAPNEWIPIPGSLEAISRLNHAGYRVVVATNQSGISRGLLTAGQLSQIHARMHAMLQTHGGYIDAVFFCPEGPDSDAPCRKPRPGMFQDIARYLDTDLRGVPAVGDSLRDLQAAEAVGAQPILVLTGKGEETLSGNDPLLTRVPVFPNLAAVVGDLLANPDGHPQKK